MNRDSLLQPSKMWVMKWKERVPFDVRKGFSKSFKRSVIAVK